MCSALMAAGCERLSAPDQAMLDFGDPVAMQPAVVTGSRPAVLVEVVWVAWSELGFNVVHAEGFFQPVLAGLVEPTSMLDSARVRADRGITPAYRATMHQCLRGSPGGAIATSWPRPATSHAIQHGGATLVLYDVTTLYFEGEHEEELLARQTGRRHSGPPVSCHTSCRSRFRPIGSSPTRILPAALGAAPTVAYRSPLLDLKDAWQLQMVATAG